LIFVELFVTLVDGHNRYGICSKHNILFKTIEREFDSKNDACIWIIQNQFGKRNLSMTDRLDLALKLKEFIQNKAKENKSTAAVISNTLRRSANNPELQKSAKPENKIEKKIDTREELAKLAGVSHDTVSKYEKIINNAPDELIKKVKAKENPISINQANKVLDMVKKEDHADEILKKAIEKIEGHQKISLENAVKEVKKEIKKRNLVLG
jgi:Helix-turn-helix.